VKGTNDDKGKEMGKGKGKRKRMEERKEKRKGKGNGIVIKTARRDDLFRIVAWQL